MKLISEISQDVQYLTEEKDGKKFLYVAGPYISVNTPNRNNRIYSKGIMEPVVEGFVKDKINNKTAYGEWGHPQGPKINEERISHRITSLDWDGNNVIGKAVVLDEGQGKIMRSIIESGGRFGMSTRGLGSVKPNSQGLQEVQNDFKLVTVDAVTDPSGLNCWVNGIMEGVDWVYDAARGSYMENKVEDLAKAMKKISKRELLEKKYELFRYYLGLMLPEEDNNQFLVHRKLNPLGGGQKTIINHDRSVTHVNMTGKAASNMLKKAKGLGLQGQKTTAKQGRWPSK